MILYNGVSIKHGSMCIKYKYNMESPQFSTATHNKHINYHHWWCALEDDITAPKQSTRKRYAYVRDMLYQRYLLW